MTAALEWCRDALAVALIGGAASVLRFLVDRGVMRRVTRGFPWGTLVVNVSGALALGALAGAELTSGAMLLAGTAAVGSYTTYSTWVYESHRLVEERRTRYALGNVVGSVLLGLGAAYAGWRLTR